MLNGRYELLERVGSGGMASVFRAQDRTLGRIVALKLLHPSLTGDEAFLRSFRHEAHAAANLAHPNIITVHDIGQDEHEYYIVMEYVQGRTLKQLIREQAETGRALPLNRVLSYAIQIAAGIGYAHRAGFVHCDVKPQNIIVTRDERVKIADFGIARAVSGASQEIRSVVWGTPQYLAPEQAAGKAASPASDVYSIGVILFEMLTNRLPFQAESQTALALMHLREPAPPVSLFNPAVPAPIGRVVAKLLAKEPASRYRTAGQLERILRAYQEQTLRERERPTDDVSELERAIAAEGQEREAPTVTRQALTRVAPLVPSDTAPIQVPAPRTPGADWATIGLGIVALVALLGLIPLWWLVYQAWAG